MDIPVLFRLGDYLVPLSAITCVELEKTPTAVTGPVTVHFASGNVEKSECISAKVWETLRSHFVILG